MARTKNHYRSVVEGVEKFALDHATDPLRLEEICQIGGVSPRTLRHAFMAVHGETPNRYLRILRLSEARRALLAATSSSVTEVAMQFGFFELGRFAVEYRRAFGECPSKTLQRATSDIDSSPKELKQSERCFSERSSTPNGPTLAAF